MEKNCLKEATRDGFGKGLVKLGAANKQVVVLSADLTDSTRAGWFKEKYPERFISVGVAEQDMIGTAAGCALMGKIPFACTFGVFASGRAWDQVRVSAAYMNLNIKIAGTHGGISVGEDGATHQAIEEIALMRILPNMAVIVPCDSREAEKATMQAAARPGPVYLRLGRNNIPVITGENDPFEIGKAVVMRKGRDISVIACGHMVNAALQAADMLAAQGIHAEIINLHTVKPIDRAAIIKTAKKTKAVLTVEEHTVMGGMGSAVAEVIAQSLPVALKIMGVEDVFGQSGEPDELYAHFKLTPRDIALQAKKLVRKKRS